jgi:hypothetical protein
MVGKWIFAGLPCRQRIFRAVCSEILACLACPITSAQVIKVFNAGLLAGLAEAVVFAVVIVLLII